MKLFRLKPLALMLIAFLYSGAAFAANYNYGEVLQKSLFFYESQRSGKLPSDNRVEWRGDSCMNDGQDVGVDLSGGWYDAGDHVKFGLPMAATATILCWGVIEQREAYESVGQLDHALKNIKWATDYFIKAHTSPNELYGQVGNGGVDHSWWGPVEVYPKDRPSYKIDAAHPGSDLAGETAASLAAASIVFKQTDPDYAAQCLKHAKELYSFADNYRGKYSDSITDAQSYYKSWSGYTDELVWGALWLYKATEDSTYLTKARSEYANLNTEPQSTIKSYKWTHAWDDKSFGSYVLFSQLTGEKQYMDDAERWLDYWTTGYQGQRINYTPGGLAWLDSWGSLRYSANTAFVAGVYSDYLTQNGISLQKAETYHAFQVSQIDYILGDNPHNRSFVCGFGNNPPVNPHHRTGHGSWSNSLQVPDTNRHILYGALVGGPGSDDSYEDARNNYVNNEVATDYNAGFTSALARMVSVFGGSPDADFPEPETKEDEFFVEAKINAQGPRFIEISGVLYNRSAWPARAPENLSYRYFVNLTEVFDAGYTLNDINIRTGYNQGSGISGLNLWNSDSNIYYVEISFNDIAIYPGGQSEHKKEVQFRLSLPENSNTPEWDNSNDWSFSGLTSNNGIQTYKIPVYNNGALIYGRAPDSDGGPDSDNDGVSDAVDQCPNTPAGEAVDSNGCSDSQKDSDNDGVTDDRDNCPNTPAGVAVDANGCPSGNDPDSDNDGVNDTIDQCPDTPSGEPVDSVGCSDSQKDSDNDGVTDDRDNCPNTPAGVAVDADGCPLGNDPDSDNDGVTDANDQCPNTPAGETVDSQGCSDSQKDSDNDGVSDDRDNCPNTPAGVSVDANGCPLGNDPDETYKNRFIEMWNELHDSGNGYFSPEGVPYHSVETLMIEAPDYGHETTSEAISYYILLEAMYGRMTGNWSSLETAWGTMEKYTIPGSQDQPGVDRYDASRPATYASEWDLPDNYPSQLETGVSVGQDPLSRELTSAYGSGQVYGMHWLFDVDNWYGYGNRGDGTSNVSYINTFQRGVQESVWETVPHPSWEIMKFGGSNGFLDLFTGDSNYSSQWRYTNAPDADARVVQAMYWANEWAKRDGYNITPLVKKSSKMGDWLRYSFFDKYFKKIGCENKNDQGATGYDSSHNLLSWYYAWGGSTQGSWSWKIGSSHVHFGYQNPVAAYALGTLNDFKPASTNGARDWKNSLDRQIEFYQWLQSSEGAIAGGATNSYKGRYERRPSDASTFYGMMFESDPVYHDPGSGTWFGWQAWSMERVAEYYYITGDTKVQNLLEKWADWVKEVVELTADGSFKIPSTLSWTGSPDTWTGSSTGNPNLHVEIEDYTQDVGVASCLAKALFYYSAAGRKWDTQDLESKLLGEELLNRMWAQNRDDLGVSVTEKRGDYERMFEQEVFIPDGWTGTMGNGDGIEKGVTFIDIRSKYKEDPAYQKVLDAYNAGTDPEFKYHRFWAQADVAIANATHYLLFDTDNGSTDSDNDGVTDANDRCPDTPTGETVDSNGCSDSQKDSDNDGVTDDRDNCPNTPAGVNVDANGCPIGNEPDSDNDGVIDVNDQCPDTPAGETVDSNGCSDSQKDSDNDGVTDDRDNCPNTPAGVNVDANGCPIGNEPDSDNDGVIDVNDQCPNTPANEPVDSNGCSDSQKDSDNDGVTDDIDQCPNTPAGVSVDAKGCPEGTEPGDLKITMTQTNSWAGGAQYEVSLTNTSTSEMTDVMVILVTDGAELNLWNMTITGSGNSKTLTLPSWKPSLAAGETYTFGFVLKSDNRPAIYGENDGDDNDGDDNDNDDDGNDNGELTVTMEQTNSWEGGAQYTVLLSNTSGIEMADIEVVLVTDGSDISLWNMVMTGSDAEKTLTLPAWKSSLAAGETYTFGFTLQSDNKPVISVE